MHNHYNRYSYVLNNPLKYTDPSGWVAMASRLTTVLLPEDYGNNIEGI
ncbi:MAG: hypothetical protein H6552_03730 [Chitinophagales bacterium]|nr:hypothetical protein [Chitinophagales bacterium]